MALHGGGFEPDVPVGWTLPRAMPPAGHTLHHVERVCGRLCSRARQDAVLMQVADAPPLLPLAAQVAKLAQPRREGCRRLRGGGSAARATHRITGPSLMVKAPPWPPQLLHRGKRLAATLPADPRARDPPVLPSLSRDTLSRHGLGPSSSQRMAPALEGSWPPILAGSAVCESADLSAGPSPPGSPLRADACAAPALVGGGPSPRRAASPRSAGSATHTVEYMSETAGAALTEERGANGFDRLLASLRWLVRRTSTGSGPRALEQAWEEAGRWISQYRNSSEVQRITPVLCQLAAKSDAERRAEERARQRALAKSSAHLQQQQQQHQGGPPPRQCTTFAAACLRPLLRTAAKSHPELTPVVAAVEQAIYQTIFLKAPAEEELYNPLPNETPPPSPNATPPVCTSPVGSAELTAPFEQRRTYAQAVAMLTRKLAAQGRDIETIDLIKSRTAAQLERIARYWKDHLVMVLFRGWRAQARKREEVNYPAQIESLTKQVAEAQEQKRRGLKELTDRATRAEAEVETLRLQMKQFTEAHKKQMKHKDELRAMQEQIDAAKAALAEVEDQCEQRVQAERDRTAKVAAVLGRVQARLQGSSYENDRRARFAHLLERAQIDLPAVLEWVNASIQDELEMRVKFFAKERKWKKNPYAEMDLRLTDLTQGGKALDHFWMLLANLSPAHVPDDMLLRNISETDHVAKAKRLLVMIEELGMLPGVDAVSLVQENCAEHQELLITTLFNRFCGATPALVEFKQREGVAEAAPVAPVDVDHWIARGVEGYDKEQEQVNKQRTLWGKVAKKATIQVMTKVTELMKTGTSQGMSTDEQQDYDKFTSLSASRDRLPKEVTDEDVEEIQEILRSNFRKLRKVFLRYAGADADMSLDEFWRMASDARIPDKAFSREQLSKVFEASNTGDDPSDVQLEGAEWVVSLIHTALVKLKKAPGTAAEKVMQLLERHVFLYCAAETDEFKVQIYQPTVQDVLQRHKGNLKRVFRYYASLDGGQGPAAAAGDTAGVAELSPAEFRKMVRDTDLIDGVCTFQALDSLFTELQGDLSVRGGSGMLYHEFAEMVCGVAVFKYPLPTLPMHMKLHQFLTLNLFPKLQSKLRLGAVAGLS